MSTLWAESPDPEWEQALRRLAARRDGLVRIPMPSEVAAWKREEGIADVLRLVSGPAQPRAEGSTFGLFDCAPLGGVAGAPALRRPADPARVASGTGALTVAIAWACLAIGAVVVIGAGALLVHRVFFRG